MKNDPYVRINKICKNELIYQSKNTFHKSDKLNQIQRVQSKALGISIVDQMKYSKKYFSEQKIPFLYELWT